MAFSLIPSPILARYKNILGAQVQATFFQGPVIWLRKVQYIDGLGNTENAQFVQVNLVVQIEYNIKRTWPLNLGSQSGESDKESMSMYMTIDYLKGLQNEMGNILTPSGYLDFDPVDDRFIHLGIIYKSTADTMGTQVSDENIKIMLVLERQLNENASQFNITVPLAPGIIAPISPIIRIPIGSASPFELQYAPYLNLYGNDPILQVNEIIGVNPTVKKERKDIEPIKTYDITNSHVVSITLNLDLDVNGVSVDNLELEIQ